MTQINEKRFYVHGFRELTLLKYPYQQKQSTDCQYNLYQNSKRILH